ncbi:MAG: helix-turn-helix transcriptional regulator [Kiritimatiellae bacterium]|nr:helix-turn-helix transcriptional regulator [Kiritimatiellia bacterium]
MVDERYIAKRIRELRKNANMDVDTVGEGVGRSGKTVSAWETGRNVPSAEMLIDLCRFFGVNIDYFYPPEVTAPLPEFPLTPEEHELVSIFAALDERDKRRLLDIARMFKLA